MQYLYREVTHKGKTIRYIKAHNFSSQGEELGPVDELIAVSKSIKVDNPDIVVVIMIGGIGTLGPVNDFMKEVSETYPLRVDEYYSWKYGNQV